MGEVRYMKEINMIVWITQLGLSIAMPLAGFGFLGYWLMNRFDMGIWVLICSFVLGLVCAFEGLHNSLKIMAKQDRKHDTKDDPGVYFNDHD